MGKLWSKLFGKKEVRILMLGLDSAGKTTLLYQFKVGNKVTTIPTIGFNIETIIYKNVKFNAWDVGGQEKIRPLWRHYYSGTQCLIYVIDSSDRERIEETKLELHKILNENEMQNALLLVYANKQDMPGAMRPGELQERLGLTRLSHDRVWYIQPSSATTGEGICEGLEWISSNHKQFRLKNKGKNLLKQLEKS